MVLTLEQSRGGDHATGSQWNGWEMKNPRPLDIWLLNKQKQWQTDIPLDGESETERRREGGSVAEEEEVARWVCGRSINGNCSCILVLPFSQKEKEIRHKIETEIVSFHAIANVKEGEGEDQDKGTYIGKDTPGSFRAWSIRLYSALCCSTVSRSFGFCVFCFLFHCQF